MFFFSRKPVRRGLEKPNDSISGVPDSRERTESGCVTLRLFSSVQSAVRRPKRGNAVAQGRLLSEGHPGNLLVQMLLGPERPSTAFFSPAPVFHAVAGRMYRVLRES